MVTVRATQPCLCSVKAATGTCVSKPVEPCANKTLFVASNLWHSYHFHVSQNILLLWILFPTLKDVKIFLVYELYKNRPRARFGPEFTDPPPPPPPAWLRSYFRVVWVAVIYVTLCVLGSVLLTFHVSAHIIPMKTLNSTYLSVGGETEASWVPRMKE